MIRSLIFDVGKVLVHFSFEEFRQFLFSKGAEISSTEEFIIKTQLELYEVGGLSSDEFLIGLGALLREQTPVEELSQRWQQIFSPQEDMIALARSLEANYQVGLLSNTSELHWNYLCSNYQLNTIGQGAVTSFGAKAMKPAPEIYLQAEQQFGLTPEHSVFIDDIAENIEAARARGWHGVQHKSYVETCAALRELGVELAV